MYFLISSKVKSFALKRSQQISSFSLHQFALSVRRVSSIFIQNSKIKNLIFKSQNINPKISK